MVSTDNIVAAVEQMVPETMTTTVDAPAATTVIAPPSTPTLATSTPAATTSANDVEASSSQAAADLAVSFPLPTMATTEPTADAGAHITAETLAEEEENQADRSRYWLPSCVTEKHLAELVEGGFLPTKADCAWRAPGSAVC